MHANGGYAKSEILLMIQQRMNSAIRENRELAFLFENMRFGNIHVLISIPVDLRNSDTAPRNNINIELKKKKLIVENT